MIERRRHLDDVDTDDRQLVTDAPNLIEELARRQSPRLRCSGARCMTGVAHVDVDAEEHAVTVVRRDRECFGHDLVEPAGTDLGHLVGTHPLLRHPLQNLGAGPIAAQSDLQEPVTTHRSGLDEPTHRLTMSDE